MFSFSLTKNNPKRRDRRSDSFYYQAIDLQVFQTGNYTFISSSVIDTAGYIYNGTFSPFNMDINLIGKFYDECLYLIEHRLIIHLHINTTYLVVITTHKPDVLGNYSIIVSGRNTIDLSPISKYFC